MQITRKTSRPIMAMTIAGLMAVPAVAFGQAAVTPANPPGTAIGRAIDRATTPDVTMTRNSVLAQRPRVSQIIGSNVYNDRNESIGEVEDVLLSPTGDRPMAVVSVGGFLGIGARLVSLPLSEMRWSTEQERMTLPGGSKEALQARPAFEYPTTRRG